MTLGFDKSYFAYIPTIANLKLSPGGILYSSVLKKIMPFILFRNHLSRCHIEHFNFLNCKGVWVCNLEYV